MAICRPYCLATLARCSSRLLLEVALENLLHLGHAQLLAGRRADALECVRRLHENRVVDDDLAVCPPRWEPVYA